MDGLLSQADCPAAGAWNMPLSTDRGLEMPFVRFTGYGYFYLFGFRECTFKFVHPIGYIIECRKVIDEIERTAGMQSVDLDFVPSDVKHRFIFGICLAVPTPS